MRVPRLVALVLALSAAFSSPDALAKPTKKVEWTKIEVRAGDDAKRVEKELKPLLEQATKKASFGKVKHVELTAKIVTLETTVEGDVARVSCTLKGRVVGGPTARSKISFGGSVNEKAALETQVLTMVANGLVTRLAEIVRARQ